MDFSQSLNSLVNRGGGTNSLSSPSNTNKHSNAGSLLSLLRKQTPQEPTPSEVANNDESSGRNNVGDVGSISDGNVETESGRMTFTPSSRTTFKDLLDKARQGSDRQNNESTHKNTNFLSDYSSNPKKTVVDDSRPSNSRGSSHGVNDDDNDVDNDGDNDIDNDQSAGEGYTSTEQMQPSKFTYVNPFDALRKANATLQPAMAMDSDKSEDQSLKSSRNQTQKSRNDQFDDTSEEEEGEIKEEVNQNMVTSNGQTKLASSLFLPPRSSKLSPSSSSISLKKSQSQSGSTNLSKSLTLPSASSTLEKTSAIPPVSHTEKHVAPSPNLKNVKGNEELTQASVPYKLSNETSSYVASIQSSKLLNPPQKIAVLPRPADSSLVITASKRLIAYSLSKLAIRVIHQQTAQKILIKPKITYSLPLSSKKEEPETVAEPKQISFIQIFERSDEASYILIIDEEGGLYVFKIHTSLAPFSPSQGSGASASSNPAEYYKCVLQINPRTNIASGKTKAKFRPSSTGETYILISIGKDLILLNVENIDERINPVIDRNNIQSLAQDPQKALYWRQERVVKAFAFSKNGNVLALLDKKGSIRVLYMSEFGQGVSASYFYDFSPVDTTDPPSNLEFVDVVNDTNRFLVLSYKGNSKIQLLNIAKGAVTQEIKFVDVSSRTSPLFSLQFLWSESQLVLTDLQGRSIYLCKFSATPQGQSQYRFIQQAGKGLDDGFFSRVLKLTFPDELDNEELLNAFFLETYNVKNDVDIYLSHRTGHSIISFADRHEGDKQNLQLDSADVQSFKAGSMKVDQTKLNKLQRQRFEGSPLWSPAKPSNFSIEAGGGDTYVDVWGDKGEPVSYTGDRRTSIAITRTVNVASEPNPTIPGRSDHLSASAKPSQSEISQVDKQPEKRHDDITKIVNDALREQYIRFNELYLAQNVEFERKQQKMLDLLSATLNGNIENVFKQTIDSALERHSKSFERNESSSASLQPPEDWSKSFAMQISGQMQESFEATIASETYLNNLVQILGKAIEPRMEKRFKHQEKVILSLKEEVKELKEIIGSRENSTQSTEIAGKNVKSEAELLKSAVEKGAKDEALSIVCQSTLEDPFLLLQTIPSRVLIDSDTDQLLLLTLVHIITRNFGSGLDQRVDYLSSVLAHVRQGKDSRIVKYEAEVFQTLHEKLELLYDELLDKDRRNPNLRLIGNLSNEAKQLAFKARQ